MNKNLAASVRARLLNAAKAHHRVVQSAEQPQPRSPFVARHRLL